MRERFEERLLNVKVIFMQCKTPSLSAELNITRFNKTGLKDSKLIE